MIRSFAALFGVRLREISINSDTDATDLVGGYEQRDLVRQIRELSARIKSGVVESLSELIDEKLQLQHAEILSIMTDLSSSQPIQKTILATLETILPSHYLDTTVSTQMQKLVDILTLLFSEDGSGKFQWYDGILVDALIHGDWVILDNANLCNPSVLDRLNSLLEPNGTLVLHEYTNSGGEPRVIQPHPNFRLFLTMDPRHGELSRAMRNRALEISLLTPDKATPHTGILVASLLVILVSPLDCYLSLSSTMRFIGEVVTSILDTGAQHKPTFHQIIEYSSFQGFPFLKRFTSSNNVFEERMMPLNILCETLGDHLGGLQSLVAFNSEYFGRLGMLESFTGSQV